MHIIHVIRQFHPSIGGMEDVVFHLAKSLKLSGHKVQVVTLNRLFTQPSKILPTFDCYHELPIIRLPFWGSSRYPMTSGLMKIIDKADLVHVHGIDFFYDFLALSRIFHQKKLIVSTHGGFFHTQFAYLLKKYWFQIVTRLSSIAYQRIIATSENDFDIFSQVVSPKKMIVIENGVDVLKFYSNEQQTIGRNIIYFGRWSINKGLIKMIELVRQLVDVDPSWTLTISGKEYDYTCANLMNEIIKRKLNKNVFLIPAPSNNELKRLIKQCHFYLCLSEHEGFGISVIESMSAGLIPILSNIGPFKRFVLRSGIGLIVNDNNYDETVKTLELFVKMSSDRYQDICNQAKRFAQSYSWEFVIKKYMDVYKNILRNNQKKSFI